MKKLSVCIITIEQRSNYFAKLMALLNPQLTDEVEVIVETDRGELSRGLKRQAALERSTGAYVCSVDDDDLISDDYVSSLLGAIKKNPDVVTFRLHWYDHAHHERDIWFRLKDIKVPETKPRTMLMKPNHLTPIRRELALKAGFPDMWESEDGKYREDVLPFLKREVHVPKFLYTYAQQAEQSKPEWQEKHQMAECDKPPEFDYAAILATGNRRRIG